jgi:hypothetical protein
MDDFMSNYNQQNELLGSQIDDLRRNKDDIIQGKRGSYDQSSKRPSMDSQQKNEELIQKLRREQLAAGKHYKDVEAEMEDYEPVLEASEKSEATVVVDAADLPK